jgi:hypothetical protein
MATRQTTMNTVKSKSAIRSAAYRLRKAAELENLLFDAARHAGLVAGLQAEIAAARIALATCETVSDEALRAARIEIEALRAEIAALRQAAAAAPQPIMLPTNAIVVTAPPAPKAEAPSPARKAARTRAANKVSHAEAVKRKEAAARRAGKLAKMTEAAGCTEAEAAAAAAKLAELEAGKPSTLPRTREEFIAAREAMLAANAERRAQRAHA